MASVIRLRVPALIATCSLVAGCYTVSPVSKSQLALNSQNALVASRLQTQQTVQIAENAVNLSLEAAIDLALHSSAEIRVREAAVAFSQAGESEATQWRNPEIRYSQEKIENGFGDQTRMDVEFRVRPPRPGDLGAQKAVAQAGTRSANARLSRERKRIRSRVRTLFREIGFVTEEKAASKRSQKARAQLVNLAKLRAERGLGTQIDVALSKVAFHDATQDVTELEAEFDLLHKELLRLVGLPNNTSLSLQQEPLSALKVSPLAPVETFIKQALSHRFELDIAAARIDAAQAETYMEKSEAWPWFSHIKVGYEMEPDEDFDGAVTGGIAVEIPLFSLNGGGIEEARARENLRRAEFDFEIEKIIAEVQEQYRAVQQAAQSLETLTSGSKVAAEAASEAARAAMNAGQVVVQELALIEERAASVHRAWLKALRRYNREHTQLQYWVAPTD